MNPWELILNVLGGGVLAIVVLTIAALVIALLKALPTLRRRPPAKTAHIIISPDK